MTREQEFGRYLKELRGKRGWSVRQAAKAYGLSHGRTTELEVGASRATGSPTRPSRDVVVRIALAHGEPVDSMLELAGYAPERPDLSHEASRLLDIFLSLDQDQQALAIRLVQAIKPAIGVPGPS